MSANTTNKWLKFFTDGGLPSTVATNYAIIFTSHRIQNDMLCDLTKEILYDMGIKTMGDVIAILRHAKSVDHNTTRDQLLGPQDMANKRSITTTTRPTLTANSHTSQALSHRFKTISGHDSTADVVNLKRSAQTSASLKSTNPKIRRVVASEDEDFNDGMNAMNVSNGSKRVVTSAAHGLESQTSSKSSVFSRLGVEKNDDKNLSIFSRLGNASGLDSVNPKRRVTITGNSINTTLDNKNVIKLNNRINSNMRSNRLITTKMVNISPKKPILAPNAVKPLRSAHTEQISVKNRIGMSGRMGTTPIANRMVVNRSVTSNLSSERLNTSSAVLQAKRIAMRRAADSMKQQKKTISLRKNIFDRLGPISL